MARAATAAARTAPAPGRAPVRVTQVVNGNKGIHVMLPKRYLARG